MILSIIIPCYNSEKFIAKTINMLLRQDLSNCELLLINDGSTDGTLLVLQKYRSIPEVVIINQVNKGVSEARNAGLLVAQGQYIYFLDSDDMLTDGSLSYFKSILSKHADCQLFCFGYETKKNGMFDKRYVFQRFDDKEISGRILTQSFLSKKLCVHICSCIYERRFLIDNQLGFKPRLSIGEDVLFLLQSMFQVDKAYYASRVSFIYLIRDDSAMQGYKSYSRTQYESHTVLRKFLLPIAQKDKDIRRYINFFLLFSYISNLRYYLKSDLKNHELNRKFAEDSKIRYSRNFAGNVSYWLVMKVFMLVPIRLLLGIFK